MKPSRIVKSAWKQAGKPCSLKKYVLSFEFADNEAVNAWLGNKFAQRKPAPRHGHENAHSSRALRTHTGNSGVSMRNEVRRGR